MIAFRKILIADLPLIMGWRTDPEITRYMSTDIEYDLKKQTKWFEEVVLSKTPAEHWVITLSGKPIGLLNLDNYNTEMHTTSWGYYIGERDSRFLGGIIPAYFYNYMFNKRDSDLRKILGHLFVENESILKIHRFYGVREKEIKKNHIKKNGKNFDILLIEMTKEDWLNKQDKFGNYQAIFEE